MWQVAPTGKKLRIGLVLLVLLLASCEPAGAPAQPLVATPVSGLRAEAPATAVLLSDQPGAATASPTGSLASGPTALPSHSTSPILPGWQTYTDREAGYSISLPPGAIWRSGKSRDGIYTARVQFQIQGVPGYQGMVIRVAPNPGQKGLDQILGELYQAATQRQPPADMLMQAQALTVAGLKGVRTSGTGTDFTVVLPYGDKVYFIAPVHDMPLTEIAPQALELFNQALATFALTR